MSIFVLNISSCKWHVTLNSDYTSTSLRNIIAADI